MKVKNTYTYTFSQNQIILSNKLCPEFSFWLMMSCDYDDVFGLDAISLFDTHFEYPLCMVFY